MTELDLATIKNAIVSLSKAIKQLEQIIENTKGYIPLSHDDNVPKPPNEE